MNGLIIADEMARLRMLEFRSKCGPSKMGQMWGWNRRIGNQRELERLTSTTCDICRVDKICEFTLYIIVLILIININAINSTILFALKIH